jgi:hypothetical protein
MNLLKSVGAVLAAVITVVVLSTGTDFILESVGIFPPFREQQEHGLYTFWMLLLAAFYRSVYGVAGSYLSATLAPNRPMLHAIIPGFIGLVASVAGTIIMWDKSPAWYPISLVLLALPCAWLGGKLREMKS